MQSGLLIAANVAGRQAVAQPAAGAPDQIDIRLRESPISSSSSRYSGLLERLARAHPALGKLPAAAAGLAAEKHLAAVPHQDDADVCAKTVRVDDVAHGLHRVCHKARPADAE